jgi:hypothetical protein
MAAVLAAVAAGAALIRDRLLSGRAYQDFRVFVPVTVRCSAAESAICEIKRDVASRSRRPGRNDTP